MRARLVLLTGSLEGRLLVPALGSGAVEIVHIETLQEWPALRRADVKTRLLTFCTAAIVPAEMLAEMSGPSYNIHPGPPSYPGRHPEAWAAYDGATSFGATLHEMAPRVDEGPIVDVRWFDMAPGGGQLDYGTRSFRAALELFMAWRRPLLDLASTLPLSREFSWSGTKRRHAELEAMCYLPADISQNELERRQRSFAQVPGSQLTLTLHGQAFLCTTPEPSPEPSLATGQGAGQAAAGSA